MLQLHADDFFPEDFELDLEDDSYSKVSVPEFRDGRSGRFLHDFKFNQSLIMDPENSRCFVMPLDRETVLPPRTMHDLLEKMMNGYYNIDTSIVRRKMKVLTPALKFDEMAEVAPRIRAECIGSKVFKLEKYQSGVFKRSASALPSSAKFGGFNGKNIVEFDFVNYQEAMEFADKNPE